MQAQTPCTDYKETKGLIYFARMLDKIRLHAEGRLAAGYFVGIEDPTSSMLAAQDFLELVMMNWRGERVREDRTRKFSDGVITRAESRAKKKSLVGICSMP